MTKWDRNKSHCLRGRGIFSQKINEVLWLKCIDTWWGLLMLFLLTYIYPSKDRQSFLKTLLVLIFNTNFLIKICICKACSNKLVYYWHSVTNEKCILDQYSDVFTGLGCDEGKYPIQFDESMHCSSTESNVKDVWKYECYFMCRGRNWQGE